MSASPNSVMMGNVINRRKNMRKRPPHLIQQDVELVRAYIENGGAITRLPPGEARSSGWGSDYDLEYQ